MIRGLFQSVARGSQTAPKPLPSDGSEDGSGKALASKRTAHRSGAARRAVRVTAPSQCVANLMLIAAFAVRPGFGKAFRYCV